MTITRHLSLMMAILIYSLQATMPAMAQGMSEEERMARVKRMLAEPNPLEPSDSVWIEDLTYMEVRDRIVAGATTAIVPTGGIEENGPFLATGKHNVILEGLCPAIAEELGNVRTANTVMLGLWAAIIEAVSKAAMRQSLADSVPPKTLEVNRKAFDVGYGKGLELKSGN